MTVRRGRIVPARATSHLLVAGVTMVDPDGNRVAVSPQYFGSADGKIPAEAAGSGEIPPSVQAVEIAGSDQAVHLVRPGSADVGVGAVEIGERRDFGWRMRREKEEGVGDFEIQ